ncbi:RTA1 like protein-domain-containing protein [Hypoxylon sp. FL1150]|nr:RTA1 like protein-domain-containing protein [Hypoxylon sp. FL1150]
MAGFKYYHYDPSFAAAVIFALMFCVATIRHIQLMSKNKTWYFLPFIIGCLFETGGYAARAWSARQTPDWTLMPYIIQSLLTLLGPTFFAASIYMILGRLIRFLGADPYSMIRSRWLTKFFLLGDILSFFGQGGGGGILASAKSESSQNLGNKVILLGLGIQVIFFGFFIVVTLVFHIRITKGPTPKSLATPAPWQRFLYVLYSTSFLIMVRSIFRMAEYAQGNDGPLLQKEAYSYVLDALLMLIVTACFAFFHPSKVLRKDLNDK